MIQNKQEVDNLCNVPHISKVILFNPNISGCILDAFYSLTMQPRTMEEIPSGYVGSLKRYNFPYACTLFGAFLPTPQWELLEYRLFNTENETYTWKKTEKPFKEYVKGFAYGFNNFSKDIVDNPYKLSNSEIEKAQTIFDYVSSIFNRGALSERYGEGIEIFSGWYDDGVKCGYEYCAWYIILSNYKLFEPFFSKVDEDQTKQISEQATSALGRSKDELGDLIFDSTLIIELRKKFDNVLWKKEATLSDAGFLKYWRPGDKEQYLQFLKKKEFTYLYFTFLNPDLAPERRNGIFKIADKVSESTFGISNIRVARSKIATLPKAKQKALKSAWDLVQSRVSS